jgi:hypothetical protein
MLWMLPSVGGDDADESSDLGAPGGGMRMPLGVTMVMMVLVLVCQIQGGLLLPATGRPRPCPRPPRVVMVTGRGG